MGHGKPLRPQCLVKVKKKKTNLLTLINAPSSLDPKCTATPIPYYAQMLHFAPSAVTDATPPLGLALESTRDQSASPLGGGGEKRGAQAVSFIAVRGEVQHAGARGKGRL